MLFTNLATEFCENCSSFINVHDSWTSKIYEQIKIPRYFISFPVHPILYFFLGLSIPKGISAIRIVTIPIRRVISASTNQRNARERRGVDFWLTVFPFSIFSNCLFKVTTLRAARFEFAWDFCKIWFLTDVTIINRYKRISYYAWLNLRKIRANAEDS